MDRSKLRWFVLIGIAAAFATALWPRRSAPENGATARYPDSPAELEPRLTTAWEKVERKQRKLLDRGPKPFTAPQDAADYFMSQRLPAGVTDYPIEDLRAELESIRARQSAEGASSPGGVLGWSELGPGNVGGRTRSIVIDPTNTDLMYAGGVAGGVWRSTDGGLSWSSTDDFLVNLAVTTIAMDPGNTSVLYAGTGEGYFAGPMVRGLGIFKSLDAGVSWNQLAGTVTGVPFGAFHYVNDVLVSPNNSNIVYAGTRTGVWRSANGGTSWGLVLRNPVYLGGAGPASNGSSAGCTELAIRTDTTPDTIFATFGEFNADGLFRSTDAGATWSQLGTAGDIQVANQGRTSLSIAPSDNDVMYVCMADNGSVNPLGQLVNVFRTVDGGNTWTGQVDFGSLAGPWLMSNLVLATGCVTSFPVYSQGWYDNVIAVDPVDPDVVWVGGVDLFRSDDGGQNFGLAAYWFFPDGDPQYVHPDHHAITFDPNFDGTTNQTMWFGNDGGIYSTDNARAATSQEDCPFPGTLPYPQIDFVDFNNGYGVTQFYHGDSARNADSFGGGCQDNGTNLVTSQGAIDSWTEVFGGDGGYFAIDHTDPQVMYLEIQFFPEIRKSIDGGATVFDAVTGITDTDGAFIAPFAMDHNDAQVLWTGGRRPWRTDDGAGLWQLAVAAVPNDPFPNAGIISAIGIAPSDSNVVYLGFNNGYVARTTNGLDPVPTWGEFGPANGLNGTYISSINVSPVDPDVAYLTHSTFNVPHVYKTSNGGLSWSSIDGISFTGVPDIPVHWIEIRPTNPQQLYVGTELGVFASDDDGANWAPANDGLANTVVESLDFKDDNTLVAFTHGRGAFITSLECASADTATYCTAKTTSQGCVPFLATGGAGVPSATDTNPFVIRGEDFTPANGGLLVYGFKKANLNFHGGKLCVKGPTRTAGKTAKSKAPATCVGPSTVGVLTNDFNNRIQGGFDPLLTVGQKVFVQWQQRDPANTIAGFEDALSNGMSFVICP